MACSRQKERFCLCFPEIYRQPISICSKVTRFYFFPGFNLWLSNYIVMALIPGERRNNLLACMDTTISM